MDFFAWNSEKNIGNWMIFWKYEVFINDAIDFLLGKVSIKVQGNCLVLHVLDELTPNTEQE